MKKRSKKQIHSSKEALGEILKRIAPYLPKTPHEEDKPSKEWKLLGKGQLPPLD